MPYVGVFGVCQIPPLLWAHKFHATDYAGRRMLILCVHLIGVDFVVISDKPSLYGVLVANAGGHLVGQLATQTP